MSNKTEVTLFRGGAEERTLPAEEIVIPDLWDISEAIRQGVGFTNPEVRANAIVECWHIAGALLQHIKDSPD